MSGNEMKAKTIILEKVAEKTTEYLDKLGVLFTTEGFFLAENGAKTDISVKDFLELNTFRRKSIELSIRVDFIEYKRDENGNSNFIPGR